MCLIKLKNVYKNYGKGDNIVHALKDVSIEFKKGEMTAIMGKSGSGKSTLLNIIGGLSKVTSGTYYYEDECISQYSMERLALFRNKNIGFVVQHFALINDMTVFENIALPLRYAKYPYKDISEKVDRLLKEMGIDEKANEFPNNFSGGQCQRVAIARALACNPKVLLADEPTGALDEETGKNILEIFKNLNKEGITVIIVTHDPSIAKLCERTITIKDGKIM